MNAQIMDAAQTARLVLDTGNDDTSSVASRTSFSSTRSIPSQHLGNDNDIDNGSGMSLSGGDEDDDYDVKSGVIELNSSSHAGTISGSIIISGSSNNSLVDNNSDNNNNNNKSSKTLLQDSNHQHSSLLDSSSVSVSTFDIVGASPPPLAAFSNLPMSRGFSASHNNNNNKGGAGGGEEVMVMMGQLEMVVVMESYQRAR